jgi:hypothetical protein
MGLFTGLWRVSMQVDIIVGGVTYARDTIVYIKRDVDDFNQVRQDAVHRARSDIPPLHTWVPGWTFGNCNPRAIIRTSNECVAEISEADWGDAGGGGGITWPGGVVWGSGGGGGITWNGGGGGISW